MANLPNQEPDFNPAPADMTPIAPLGIKNPLLPPNPLGQNFLSPKFLSPLGAKPLASMRPLAFSHQEMPGYSLSETSFLDTSVLEDFPLSPSSEPESIPFYEGSLESGTVEATISNSTLVKPSSEREISQEERTTVQEAIDSTATPVVTESVTTESEVESQILPVPKVIQPTLELQPSDKREDGFLATPQPVQTAPPTELISEASSVQSSSTTPESIPDNFSSERPTVVQTVSEIESPQQSTTVVPDITELQARSQPTELQLEANVVLSPLLQEPSSSITTSTTTESIVQSQEADSPIASATTETKPTPQPVVQAFTEDLLTQSNSVETTPTIEQLIQSQEVDSSITFATTETTPTPQPIVQAFAEDLSTQSNSAETTPTVESLVQPQETDSPIASATTETTPTPQPVVQAFAEDLLTQSNSVETTPTVESLVQSQEVDSSIASVTTETTPTPQPVVQAFTEDLLTQSSSNETIPTIEQLIQSQETDSPIASATTEITPTPQLVIPPVAEDLSTQSNSAETTPTVESLIQPQEADSPIASATTEITPTPQPIVQAFAEDLSTQSNSAETTPTVESLVQPQETDSPIVSATTETTPTPQPVVQAFTEDLSTQSNSVEPTPNIEPIIQPQPTNSPIGSAVTETTPIPKPVVQAFAEDLSAQSSSNETTPNIEPIIQPQPTNSPIISAVTETTPTPQPVVQAFTEDLSTQSSSNETTPTVESLVQPQETDSPIASATTEITPTPQPVVQAFAEDLLTQSSSNETTPTVESLVQSQEADSPIASVTTETTPTPQPVVQAFTEDLSTQSNSAETTPNLEPLVQPETTDSSTESAEETTPTLQPIVQPQAIDSPTQFNQIDSISTQPSILSAFLETSSAESASTETIPIQKPVVQAFRELVTDEFETENLTSPEQILVQSFSETEIIPQLPTVLENLAPLQPLGSAKPLAQQSDFLLGVSSDDGAGEQLFNLQSKPAELQASQKSVIPASFEPVPVESVAAEAPPMRRLLDPAFLESTSTNSTAVGNDTLPFENDLIDRAIATPPHTTSSPSITENTTSIEPTIVQAVSETATFPELPTVLENLALLQPLSSAKPLAQQSNFPLGTSPNQQSQEQSNHLQQQPTQGSGDAFKEKENASKPTLSIVPVPPITLNHEPFILQRFVPDANQDRTPQPNQEIQPLRHSTPTGNIPNSWSSITELLGESRTDSISTNSQDTLIQRVNNPSSTLEALDLAVNASGTTSQYSSSYDSPLVLGTDTSSSVIEQKVVSKDISSGENSSQQTDSKNLELLAREIYSLLRQRLEIERERRGSYYSDRFP
jgi:hypothetical protein